LALPIRFVGIGGPPSAGFDHDHDLRCVKSQISGAGFDHDHDL
jgi:hypothetical protein